MLSNLRMKSSMSYDLKTKKPATHIVAGFFTSLIVLIIISINTFYKNYADALFNIAGEYFSLYSLYKAI